MDLCRVKCLNPFLCGVIVDRELAAKEDIDDKILTVSHAIAVHRTHDIAGNVMDLMVLQFDKKETFNQVFQRNDIVFIKVAEKSYQLEKVRVGDVSRPQDAKTMQDRQKEMKQSKVISKNVRKIKPFSGITPIPAGESCCEDWVDLAQDMIDYDIHLSSVELFCVLRNSLFKNALTTVASSDLKYDPQELVNTIKMTYGYSHSAEHLMYEFHKVEQKDLEKPSALWTRLQTLGNQIKRIDSKFDLCMERFKQFKFALNPIDHELLDTHYGIESKYDEGNFPDYVEFLQHIQTFERDKRERLDRNKRNGIRSALVTVESQSVNTVVSQPTNVNTNLTASIQTPPASATPSPLNTQGADAEVLAVTMQRNDSHANHQSFKPHYDRQQRQKKEKPKRIINCYNCNEEGHRYSKCPKAFDPVIFKANFDKAKAKQQEFEAKKSPDNPN